MGGHWARGVGWSIQAKNILLFPPSQKKREMDINTFRDTLQVMEGMGDSLGHGRSSTVFMAANAVEGAVKVFVDGGASFCRELAAVRGHQWVINGFRITFMKWPSEHP